jgi:type IV pilus biogenesis protein CpaD/CtpE
MSCADSSIAVYPLVHDAPERRKPLEEPMALIKEHQTDLFLPKPLAQRLTDAQRQQLIALLGELLWTVAEERHPNPPEEASDE